MEIRPIKLSPKKDGYGNISSYSINIGRLEAQNCGFIDSDGNIFAIEKVLDVENKQIIIKLRTAD